MKKEVTFRMTQKQLNRYHIIKDSLEGKLTVAAAAKAMGISERQATRLRKGVETEGPEFLIHKNLGRSPPHAVTEDEKQKIVELYRGEVYEGSNFLHYSELLAEHEGIKRSQPTVHRVLREAQIESPKKRRRFITQTQGARRIAYPAGRFAVQMVWRQRNVQHTRGN